MAKITFYTIIIIIFTSMYYPWSIGPCLLISADTTSLFVDCHDKDDAKTTSPLYDSNPCIHDVCWLCSLTQLSSPDHQRITRHKGRIYQNVLNLLMLLLPGAAITYYGEELGLEETHVEYEQLRDPWGYLAGPVSTTTTHTTTSPTWHKSSLERQNSGSLTGL